MAYGKQYPAHFYATGNLISGHLAASSSNFNVHISNVDILQDQRFNSVLSRMIQFLP